jgi:hypothetical protein
MVAVLQRKLDLDLDKIQKIRDEKVTLQHHILENHGGWRGGESGGSQ